MSRFRPVIRVFVSSTFSDLKEERNVLQREVFPHLQTGSGGSTSRTHRGPPAPVEIHRANLDAQNRTTSFDCR